MAILQEYNSRSNSTFSNQERDSEVTRIGMSSPLLQTGNPIETFTFIPPPVNPRLLEALVRSGVQLFITFTLWLCIVASGILGFGVESESRLKMKDEFIFSYCATFIVAGSASTSLYRRHSERRIALSQHFWLSVATAAMFPGLLLSLSLLSNSVMCLNESLLCLPIKCFGMFLMLWTAMFVGKFSCLKMHQKLMVH